MAETDPAKFPQIYRAITKKSWYDSNSRRISHAAFVLRKRETGLSVLKAVGCSHDVCTAAQRDCFGGFVLNTATVIQLGLDIIDDDPGEPYFSANHAEIINLPIDPKTLEEKKQAEDFATALAEISNLHYDRYQKYV